MDPQPMIWGKEFFLTKTGKKKKKVFMKKMPLEYNGH